MFFHESYGYPMAPCCLQAPTPQNKYEYPVILMQTRNQGRYHNLCYTNPNPPLQEASSFLCLWSTTHKNTKICMSPQRRLPSLGSNVVDWVGACGLQGGSLCWCWESCPGKALAGAAGAAPGKGLAGGVHLALLLFVSLSCGFARLVPLASLLCPT